MLYFQVVDKRNKAYLCARRLARNVFIENLNLEWQRTYDNIETYILSCNPQGIHSKVLENKILSHQGKLASLMRTHNLLLYQLDSGQKNKEIAAAIVHTLIHNKDSDNLYYGLHHAIIKKGIDLNELSKAFAVSENSEDLQKKETPAPQTLGSPK